MRFWSEKLHELRVDWQMTCLTSNNRTRHVADFFAPRVTSIRKKDARSNFYMDALFGKYLLFDLAFMFDQQNFSAWLKFKSRCKKNGQVCKFCLWKSAKIHVQEFYNIFTSSSSKLNVLSIKRIWKISYGFSLRNCQQ